MLELLLFGTIEVKVGGTALHNLSAKARLLLAYLALHAGRPVATGNLADALFPNSQAEDPHGLIKKTASELRRLLGEEGYRLSSPAPRRLVLDLEGASVDWLAFKQAIQKGDTESLQHAVALHAQPLLDMEPLYWAINEQENCLRLRQRALETLFQGAMERGDLESAGSWLSQMLTFELPEVTIREALWRELLEALLSRQEYGKVQRYYRRLQAFLGNTIGRMPEAETQALYSRIPKSVQLQLAAAGSKKKKRALPDSARLPHFPFALLGRDAEKRELLATFKNSRLVTVVGIGGVGKTRFAAQAGVEIGADYKDEVGFIDLTPCTANDLLQTLANTLQIKVSASQPPYEALREFLAPARFLLILDNCEHLIEATADLVSHLIRDCPHLRLLLTSREMLRVEGEQVFLLPPLALPAKCRTKTLSPPSEVFTLACVLESPAVRLFVERATAVNPGFRLTEENSELIVELCRLVDGLPLGIEMVASQTVGVPLERVAGALAESVLRLKHGKRGILPRHQTLQAALDWSYGMLSAAERILLRRLAVFSGGWTLEAAEQVCADATLPQAEIAPALSALVAKSLVVMEHADQRALPYRFLETIRAYAAERLNECEEAGQFQAAHGSYYLQTLTGIGDLSQLKEYLMFVDRNRSNLYSAMQRSLEEPDRMLSGHRLGMSLHAYWAHRALGLEGRDWHRSFLKAGGACLPRSALAASMLEIAEFSAALGQGDSAEAENCRKKAFEIYRELGDRKGESDCYLAMGMRRAYTGPHEEAYVYFKQAYDYYQQAEPPYMRAFLLIVMSGCLRGAQHDEAAQAMYLEALEIARTRKMPSLEGLALMSMGERACTRGDLDRAEQYFTQSITAYRAIDSPWGSVKSGSQLADIKRRRGDLARAQELLYGCLVRSGEFSSRRETLYLLAFCARLLHARRDWNAVLSLSTGLLHLSEQFPEELELDAHREELEAAIREATAHLGEEEAGAIRAVAKSADFDTLLDYTLVLLQTNQTGL